jgi:ribosomal protein S13
MDDLINIELELELKALRKEIDQLKKENENLRDVIISNDLGDEIGIEKVISPEEEICLLGIEQILEAVKHKVADKNDIQNYDILHKNLRLIRGQTTDTKARQKKTSKADLLKIVEGKK